MVGLEFLKFDIYNGHGFWDLRSLFSSVGRQCLRTLPRAILFLKYSDGETNARHNWQELECY